MPKLTVTTKSAEKIWSSPDGQRKIYKLSLDYQGQSVEAKTYSDAIASVGWSGEVETYEKSNKGGGSDTFVKQPPKENRPQGYAGGQSRSNYGAKTQTDNFTMYLSYAKDIAVALIGAGDYNNNKLAEIVNDVAIAGEQLFDAHENKDKQDKVEPADDELADLKDIFGDDENFTVEGEGEPEPKPWPPTD